MSLSLDGRQRLAVAFVFGESAAIFPVNLNDWRIRFIIFDESFYRLRGIG